MKRPPADNLPWPDLPDERFPVLSLDPPWHFESRAPVANPDSDRSPQAHYPTADLRHNAECCILGRIGSPRRARADIRQVIVSPRREHSRKPEEYYRRVEHYAYGPRIDMFAGADRPGWARWGYGHRDGEGTRYKGEVAL
jgi:N6-adenosine-specific RNA methylase IME4